MNKKTLLTLFLFLLFLTGCSKTEELCTSFETHPEITYHGSKVVYKDGVCTVHERADYRPYTYKAECNHFLSYAEFYIKTYNKSVTIESVDRLTQYTKLDCTLEEFNEVKV